MNNMPTSVITAIILLTIVAAAVVLYFVWRGSAFKKGSYGDDVVARYLQRYCLSRNFKALRHTQVSDGEETLQLDHVLVGFFGVLFVTVLQVKGELYGDIRDPKWVITDGNRRTSLQNPLMEGQRKLAAFRSILSRRKIYNIPVEHAVVVVSHGEPKLYLTNAEAKTPVFTLKQFKRYLSTAKFEQDNNLDVEQLVRVMDGCGK